MASLVRLPDGAGSGVMGAPCLVPECTTTARPRGAGPFLDSIHIPQSPQRPLVLAVDLLFAAFGAGAAHPTRQLLAQTADLLGFLGGEVAGLPRVALQEVELEAAGRGACGFRALPPGVEDQLPDPLLDAVVEVGPASGFGEGLAEVAGAGRRVPRGSQQRPEAVPFEPLDLAARRDQVLERRVEVHQLHGVAHAAAGGQAVHE